MIYDALEEKGTKSRQKRATILPIFASVSAQEMQAVREKNRQPNILRGV